VLRGRCACNAVAYEAADEFVAAFNCHCSNCRALTGSAFLPWGEIERGKVRVTMGRRCAADERRCRRRPRDPLRGVPLASVLDSACGASVRVPYGSLVDEPALKPTAHMFVGSKAPWHQITDDLPQHDEYPW
jgi:hypothetical protein